MESWVDLVFGTRQWTLLSLGHGVRDARLVEEARRRLGDPPVDAVVVIFMMPYWGTGGAIDGEGGWGRSATTAGHSLVDAA